MRNLLFRTHDPRLYEVILHRSRYQNHIWLQHEIMVEEIQHTIESPDVITADQRDEYKENYYAHGVVADFPDMYLKVCVLFKQEIGRVLTAFIVSLPKVKKKYYGPSKRTVDFSRFHQN